MKKILILNLGTTSFKGKLYHAEGSELRFQAGGEIESVGAAESRYRLEDSGGQVWSGSICVPDHSVCVSFFLEELQRGGLLKDLGELSAIGYKAVHGGNLSGTRLVDEELLAEMERMTPLAPAHNPVYLTAIRDIRSKYPELVQVVRFETSFHSTIPEYRTAYGVPYAWGEELGVRRYGFHGSSHEYIAWTMGQLQPRARRIISCHLGGSSSICAILDGKSVACSMGATPQSGLFHNNRVGDFDIFCLPLLLERLGCGVEEVLRRLSEESGLLGLSGVSNDLRQVLEAAERGNVRAGLAVDALVDGIVGYIGMYTACLGGVDSVVFTGGIGVNSSEIRSRVCAGLAYMGCVLDADKNGKNAESCISAGDTGVTVWRIRTDEEYIVARNVCELLL